MGQKGKNRFFSDRPLWELVGLFAVCLILFIAAAPQDKQILTLNFFQSHNDRYSTVNLPVGHYVELINFNNAFYPGMLVPRMGMTEQSIGWNQGTLSDTAIRFIRAPFTDKAPTDSGYFFFLIAPDTIRIIIAETLTTVRESKRDSLVFQSNYSNGLVEDSYGAPNGANKEKNYGSQSAWTVGTISGAEYISDSYFFNDSIVSEFGADTVRRENVDSVVIALFIYNGGTPTADVDIIAAGIPDSGNSVQHNDWIDGDYNSGTNGYPNRMYSSDTAGVPALDQSRRRWGESDSLIPHGYILNDTLETSNLSNDIIITFRVDSSFKTWAYDSEPNLGVRLLPTSEPSESWSVQGYTSERTTVTQRPKWIVYWTHDYLDSTFISPDTTVAIGYNIYKATKSAIPGWTYENVYLNYPPRLVNGTDTVYALNHNRDISWNLVDNVLRINAAEKSSNDTSTFFSSLWHGVVGDSFFYRQDTVRYWSTQLLNNRVIYKLLADTEDTLMLAATADGTQNTTDHKGLQYYRFTYIYDYFQSSTFVRDSTKRVAEQVVTGNDSVTIRINIPATQLSGVSGTFGSSDTVEVPGKLNKRITGIEVFRADVDTGGSLNDASFRRVRGVDLINPRQWGVGVDQWNRVSYGSSEIHYSYFFADTLNYNQWLTKETYHSYIGHFSSNDWLVGNMSIYINGRRFMADVYKWEDDSLNTHLGREYKNRIYYCAKQNVTLPAQFSPDVFPSDHFFQLGGLNTEITGLAEWRERLVIFTRNSIYTAFISDPIDNTRFEEILFIDGPSNQRSVIETPHGIVWAGTNNIYLYNGRVLVIGNEILPNAPYDDTKSHSWDETWFAGYDPQHDEYYITSDTTGYVYNFRVKGWIRHEYSKNSDGRRIIDYVMNDTLYALWTRDKGEVRTPLRQGLSIANDNGVRVVKKLKSKIINFGDDYYEKDILGMTVRYQLHQIYANDFWHTFIYVDGDSVFLTDSLRHYIMQTDSTKMMNEYIPFPFAMTGKDFQFEFIMDLGEISLHQVGIVWRRRTDRWSEIAN